MCYDIDLLEDRILLKKGFVEKEVLVKDIKYVAIKLRTDYFLKFFLIVYLFLISGIIFLELELKIYELFFLVVLLFHILFIEFNKCREILVLKTAKETIRVNLNNKSVESSEDLIGYLYLRDFKLNTAC